MVSWFAVLSRLVYLKVDETPLVSTVTTYHYRVSAGRGCLA